MIRAELTQCFVVVLFLLVSGQILFCPAPCCLSGHTNRNSTIIKHRASSALVSPALLLFLLTWPNHKNVSEGVHQNHSAQQHQRFNSPSSLSSTAMFSIFILPAQAVYTSICHPKQLRVVLTLSFPP